MAMVLLVVLTLAVAYANGANDVSKGVATLVGSGVTNLRRAILWGTAWTVAGGIVAAFASQGLVAVFSGRGILVADAASNPVFLMAIACGVTGWLAIATRTGLPVSTTHALLGGLVGAGIAARGVAGVSWTAVATKTALPLAVSPVLALALVIGVAPLIRRAFQRLNRYCVCVEEDQPVLVAGSAAALVPDPSRRVIAGAECPPRVVARVNAMDSLHWFSSGSTSFFRGLNDTPKILALGVVAAGTTGVAAPWFFVMVAVAMGAGSYLAGTRVTETLAGKVTRIAHDDGFAANLVTSALVGAASMFALPVSTTHVSAGAITGVGVRKQDVRWKMVRNMVLAWIVTLPVAALVAASAYVLFGPGLSF